MAIHYAGEVLKAGELRGVGSQNHFILVYIIMITRDFNTFYNAENSTVQRSLSCWHKQ